MKVDLNIEMRVNTSKPVKFSKLYKGCYFVFSNVFKESDLTADPNGFYFTKLYQKIDSIRYYSSSQGVVGVDYDFNKKDLYVASLKLILPKPSQYDAVLGTTHK